MDYEVAEEERRKGNSDRGCTNIVAARDHVVHEREPMIKSALRSSIVFLAVGRMSMTCFNGDGGLLANG